MTLGLGWGLAPGVASANPAEDIYGLGSRAKGMGGAGTALVDDFSAVYYNPAGLGFCPGNSASAEVNAARTAAWVRDAHPAPQAQAIPLRSRAGLGACLRGPLQLTGGFYLAMGVNRPAVFNLQSIDPVPRFVLHDARVDGMSLMFGVAYRPIEDLSLGVGLSLLANSALVAANRVPVISEAEVHNDLRWNPTMAAAVYAGARLRVSPQLTVAATYRGALYHRLDARAETEVEVAGVLANIDLILESVMWYSPQQAAVGAAFSAPGGLTAAVDVTWYDWSAFPGPFIVATPDAGSPVAETLRFPPRERPRFHDVIWPRAGLEYGLLGALAARVGYGFRPTPAPTPTGRANLLDATTQVATLGLGWAWRADSPRGSDALGLASAAVDLQASLGWLASRRVHKDAAQPQLNDYSFGGTFQDIGATVALGF